MTKHELAEIREYWEDVREERLGVSEIVITAKKHVMACVAAIEAEGRRIDALRAALCPFAYPDVVDDTFVVLGKDVNRARDALALITDGQERLRPGV